MTDTDQSGVDEAMAEFFDRLSSPVFIVDARMRILYSNASADEMLDENGAVKACDGALFVHDPRSREALAQAVHAGANPDVVGLAVMLKSGGARCCVVHVTPLSDGGAALFVRRFNRDASDGAVVSGLFGLTARERSVLLAIAEIGGVPATARALGLSEGTVKGYLKSIFQKTGASRQADLVKLVMALESPFRAPARDVIPA